MSWLGISIVLSVVLTVALNVVLRTFPGASERIDQKLAQAADERRDGGIYVPWKAMIVVSLVLTIGLNLLLWTRR